MKKYLFGFALFFLFASCNQQANETVEKTKSDLVASSQPYIQILGVAQDAGYPQLGCKKSCCKDLWSDIDARKMVSCIGLLDPMQNDYWVFDATPDIKDQIARCNESLGNSQLEMPNGLFITHAHIGHYTGLMQFGREAFGSDQLPVYAMPRMNEFLTSNGPWSQLVSLKNIALKLIANDKVISISSNLKVVPFVVPHRDEFSETVGYKIIGPDKSVLFIPDIDKWEKWDRDIITEISKVDVALLDGSFFRNGEIFGRDMSLIPHPFIEESMKLFSELSTKEKSKIHFIHFNHTNPVLRKESDAYKEVIDNGFNIAEEGQKIFI
jgi:pyrroloquinoline quinone biosynthesis protein B